MRFVFSTAVWGAEYTRSLLELSLPTQLAEGNLDGSSWMAESRYQIFTTKRDAQVIREAPIFRRLSRTVETEFVYIDNIGATNKYNLISQCQMEALRRNEDFDGIFYLYPDFIWSKGCFERAAARIVDGCEAVVCPVPRVVAEAMADGLFEAREFVSQSKDGCIVTLAARDLVALSLKYMHPMMNRYLWNAERFSEFPSYLMWEVPNQGILMRCYHLHPIAMRIAHDNPGLLLRFSVSLDEEYLPRLFKSGDDIHVATDSDELALCSLTPADLPYSSGATSLRANVAYMAQWAEEYAALLHRELIETPFRWHHTANDETLWAEVERRSRATVAAIGERLRVPDSVLRIEDTLAYAARKRRLRRFGNWRRPKYGPPAPFRFDPPVLVPGAASEVLETILTKRFHRAVLSWPTEIAVQLPGYGAVRRGLLRFGFWRRVRERIRTDLGSEWNAVSSHRYLPTGMIVSVLLRRIWARIARRIGLKRAAQGDPYGTRA